MVSAASAGSPLSAIIDNALHTGTATVLPPKVALALGLGRRNQATPVRQLLSRDDPSVGLFNVGPGRRHEIVLASANESAGVTTAFLMTPAGRLPKFIPYAHDGGRS